MASSLLREALHLQKSLSLQVSCCPRAPTNDAEIVEDTEETDEHLVRWCCSCKSRWCCCSTRWGSCCWPDSNSTLSDSSSTITVAKKATDLPPNPVSLSKKLPNGAFGNLLRGDPTIAHSHEGSATASPDETTLTSTAEVTPRRQRPPSATSTLETPHFGIASSLPSPSVTSTRASSTASAALAW
eukprot:CAMPEP_0206449162 /NCGR_PEP_ID=MMETSP0324_2-20121206/17926_1 /ASSEMBLY_ACC=CAM_ASM_000836 /TAXON_ID=2866 /ORGANISM="Crypthecodinium cohnii, Strain Seligo" /LENGTH=184 /DNA_ID=CAMNT_0053918489 /DNA_START=335 /DNA_END=886 /DNA_ORIENTATION=-